ncbi:MAG: cytochrome c [Alphaproteobacteria bacterium]|nr:cytochrome c [Myxococcales bacterium]MCB9686032.1 cytochrome c [Alphaproteobacteria bacterium]MCB9699979.1 cytochrome c [Alphaproteobacteria bacterium]
MKSRNLIPVAALALLTVGGAVLAAEPEPTTLKAIMAGMRVEMSRIHEALWTEDFDTMSTAARAVADHPHVSAEERTRIQGLLGPDFGGFVAADKAVHDAAVRLSEAAAANDMDKSLKELDAVQTGCVACHTDYRERLLPAKTSP